MNIFEINEAIKTVQEKAKDEDFDAEAFKDTLDSLKATREDKLDGLAGWYNGNEGQLQVITEKIKELQAYKKQLANQNEWIMSYMTKSIDDAGIKKLQTKNHILKPRNSRARTVIDDESLIPKEYITTETKKITKIDKNAIYQTLKDGVAMTGAHLEENRKTRIL